MNKIGQLCQRRRPAPSLFSVPTPDQLSPEDLLDLDALHQENSFGARTSPARGSTTQGLSNAIDSMFNTASSLSQPDLALRIVIVSGAQSYQGLVVGHGDGVRIINLQDLHESPHFIQRRMGIEPFLASLEIITNPNSDRAARIRAIRIAFSPPHLELFPEFDSCDLKKPFFSS